MLHLLLGLHKLTFVPLEASATQLAQYCVFLVKMRFYSVLIFRRLNIFKTLINPVKKEVAYVGGSFTEQIMELPKTNHMMIIVIIIIEEYVAFSVIKRLVVIIMKFYFVGIYLTVGAIMFRVIMESYVVLICNPN